MGRTFLHKDDSVEWIDLFPGVAASRDSNGVTMYFEVRNCLVGVLT